MCLRRRRWTQPQCGVCGAVRGSQTASQPPLPPPPHCPSARQPGQPAFSRESVLLIILMRRRQTLISARADLFANRTPTTRAPPGPDWPAQQNINNYWFRVEYWNFPEVLTIWRVQISGKKFGLEMQRWIFPGIDSSPWLVTTSYKIGGLFSWLKGLFAPQERWSAPGATFAHRIYIPFYMRAVCLWEKVIAYTQSRPTAHNKKHSNSQWQRKFLSDSIRIFTNCSSKSKKFIFSHLQIQIIFPTNLPNFSRT